MLVNMGVYKNVEDLTDKEIISEYNKLKKQSSKLQKKIKTGNKFKDGFARIVSGQTDRSSINSNTEDNNEEEKQPDSLKANVSGSKKIFLQRDSMASS